jgi:hypothetical protein
VHSLAAHIGLGLGLRLFQRILTGADMDAAIAAPDGPELAGWVVVGLGPLVTALQEVRRTSRCPSRTIPGTSPPG